MSTDQRYRFCVIGDLTPRQKLLTTRFLLDCESRGLPAIAADEHNAATMNFPHVVNFLVVFRPYAGKCPNTKDYFDRMRAMGWPRERVLIESYDFEQGAFPRDPMTEDLPEPQTRALMSDDELESSWYSPDDEGEA